MLPPTIKHPRYTYDNVDLEALTREATYPVLWPQEAVDLLKQDELLPKTEGLERLLSFNYANLGRASEVLANVIMICLGRRDRLPML